MGEWVMGEWVMGEWVMGEWVPLLHLFPSAATTG